MLLNLSGGDADSMKKPKPPKRMLETSTDPDSGKLTVSINSSSLDLLQTCLRKADYILNQKLISNEESAALAFGTSVHKALEHWYSLPQDQRLLPKGLEEKAELLSYGHDLHTPAEHGALEAIRQFVLARYDVLKGVDENDKRSLLNGTRILKSYFRRYADDGLEVARDEHGPVIERQVEFVMSESPSLVIKYFGTIDVVLKNTHTGVNLITDHKTTSALGQEFYNRCKPNPQYTGYVWAAREALGIDSGLFMINGIQVAKTKHEFARQITSRDEEDFMELSQSVHEVVSRWLNAVKLDSFPMSSPNPCAAYGGCQFLKVCEVPSALKPSVISALWPKGE
jgi:hypothetical protein